MQKLVNSMHQLWICSNRMMWWLNISMANKLLFTPLAARTAARYSLNITMNFLEYDTKYRPQVGCH